MRKITINIQRQAISKEMFLSVLHSHEVKMIIDVKISEQQNNQIFACQLTGLPWLPYQ